MPAVGFDALFAASFVVRFVGAVVEFAGFDVKSGGFVATGGSAWLSNILFCKLEIGGMGSWEH